MHHLYVVKQFTNGSKLEFSSMGYILLAISLVCDGAVASLEDKVKSDYNVNPYNMMRNMTQFSMIGSLVSNKLISQCISNRCKIDDRIFQREQ